MKNRDVAFENENTRSIADTREGIFEAEGAKSFSPINASIEADTLNLNPRQPPVISQPSTPPRRPPTSPSESPQSLPATSQQALSDVKLVAPRMAKTYPNLTSAGEMQAAYGRLVKGIGIAIGVIGGIAGMATLGQKSDGFVIALIVWSLAFLVALVIHAIGTFLAAIGEAMQALADIATNSWPKQG